jgi:hypothetical protein
MGFVKFVNIRRAAKYAFFVRSVLITSKIVRFTEAPIRQFDTDLMNVLPASHD